MANPDHNHGFIHPLPYKTIATFPPGTFLENLAVLKNGTLLISAMSSGEIYYLDPTAPNPQSTVLVIHSFNAFSTAPTDNTNTNIFDDTNTRAHKDSSTYGSSFVAEAIVEDATTPDVFYTMSGRHGIAGTWAVYKLDMRDFDLSFPNPKPKISKIADVPEARWLNGATFLPSHNILLMAESLQGNIISCGVVSGKVETWLQDERLRTTREGWPGVNGVQYFRGGVFVTSSSQGLVLRAGADGVGKYEEGSLRVLVESVVGDDLAFDERGNAYVATNPRQSVIRLGGLGLRQEGYEDGGTERMTILGGIPEREETAGPTAVGFGRTDRDGKALYVVTTGGILNPVGGRIGPAQVLRVDVGFRGE